MLNNLFSFLKRNNIFNKVVDFFNIVSTYECCFCNNKLSDDKYICEDCLKSIHIIKQSSCCKVCGYPLPDFIDTGNFLDKKQSIVCPSCQSGKRYFNIARSVFQYKGIIRKCLMNLKFYFQTDFLSFIGEEIYKVYKTMPKVDYICFIPITRVKLFCKGYNHAGLIASSFFKVLKKTSKKEVLLYDFIVKTKSSQSSKELSQTERWLKKYNFSINQKYTTDEFIKKISGKHILIIDDIMTTGATLNVASKIIKQTFPKSNVYCLTFARTMLY